MQRRRIYTIGALLVAIALPLAWWGQQQRARAPESPPGIAVFPASKPGPAASAPLELTAADETAIAAIIRQQLAAFQADDAELALSFASPDIQDQFETADEFMGMVQTMYEPVYRPQSVDFGPVEFIQGRPVQAVIVLGPSGTWVTAYYQMEKQPDETWRIAGCVLAPVEGETI
ncbi:DUF4864 domain-containing protein [Halomicronema sp. CCY15110]|uniref:DUF4864 domain-containing protein n=1 Tax=Halomicronema sp. CCY15110 TaxID=2767773 RepID=UPI00194E0CB1|nr:DUF4864 domain-containing protein [Halomicronema sp. CCY15110]